MMLASSLGHERHKSSRDSGTVCRLKDSKRDPIIADCEGAAGEIGFAKLVNSFPDLEIRVRGQETDCGDLHINGVWFDVKATRHSAGHLTCATWKNDKPHAYALMLVNWPHPEVVFAGWAWAKDLKKKENHKDFGGGKGVCYALPQSRLEHLQFKTFTT